MQITRARQPQRCSTHTRIQKLRLSENEYGAWLCALCVLVPLMVTTQTPSLAIFQKLVPQPTKHNASREDQGLYANGSSWSSRVGEAGGGEGAIIV